MKSSALTNLLFSSGIPTDGYDFDRTSAVEREIMVEEITSIPDAIISEGSSLTFVEVESKRTIWLITREGHFAHPSMLKRALSGHGQSRAIQVSGFTECRSEVMMTWMEQFREQDIQMFRAIS